MVILCLRYELFNPDAGGLHDLRPLGNLDAKHFTDFLGCADVRLGAFRLEALLGFRQPEVSRETDNYDTRITTLPKCFRPARYS